VQALEAQLADLRTRRAAVAEQLDAARARKAVAATAAASAVLDAPDAKAGGLRRDHAAAAAEVEIIELALATADERIEGLVAALAAARRRVAVVAVLDQLDALVAAADALDATWGPVREALAQFILRQQDTATALNALMKRYGSFDHSRSPAALARLLLWPIGDLLDLPRADAQERVPVAEAIRQVYTRARTTLQRELAGEKGGEG
jgi:hypothetical protein